MATHMFPGLRLDVTIDKARHARAAVRIALAVLAALVVGVLLWAPLIVALVVVVGGAVGWCIWLERHPEMPSSKR
jgi:hypothetical protein